MEALEQARMEEARKRLEGEGRGKELERELASERRLRDKDLAERASAEKAWVEETARLRDALSAADTRSAALAAELDNLTKQTAEVRISRAHVLACDLSAPKAG